MNSEKAALAERTNRGNLHGTLADVMKGRDLFIGVSQANLVSEDMVRSMAKDPIVFALANPSARSARPRRTRRGGHRRRRADDEQRPGVSGHLPRRPGRRRRGHHHPHDDGRRRCPGRRVGGDQLLPEMMDPATHQAVAEAVMKAV